MPRRSTGWHCQAPPSQIQTPGLPFVLGSEQDFKTGQETSSGGSQHTIIPLGPRKDNVTPFFQLLFPKLRTIALHALFTVSSSVFFPGFASGLFKTGPLEKGKSKRHHGKCNSGLRPASYNNNTDKLVVALLNLTHIYSLLIRSPPARLIQLWSAGRILIHLILGSSIFSIHLLLRREGRPGPPGGGITIDVKSAKSTLADINGFKF